MLKIILYCDKCKKEILPNTMMIFVGKLLEVKTSMPNKELLAPLKLPQRGNPIFLEEILETKIHLCSICYLVFKEWLEKENLNILTP